MKSTREQRSATNSAPSQSPTISPAPQTVSPYGNAAAQPDRTGALADQLPSNLELASLGTSFTLPGDRELLGGWHPLSTGEGTPRVWLDMSSSALRVSVWPPMVVDAQWPMSNVEWSGFTYDFKTGSVGKVDVQNTQLLAFGAKGFVDDAVREFVTKLVAGTPLAKAGYDPLHDPDPNGTLQMLYANMGGGGGTGGAPPIGLADLKGIIPSASFKTREEIVQGAAEGGIRIPQGTSVTASAALRGSAADLQKGGLQGVDYVQLSTGGIILESDGKPVAKLEQLTLLNGGEIRVDRFTPMGKLEKAAAVESGFKALFALFQLAAAREGVNTGPITGNTNPDIVTGVAESQISRALSAAVRTLVETHHDVVPGVDLRSVLGITPQTAPATTTPR